MTLKRMIFRMAVRGLESLCMMHRPSAGRMEHLSVSPLPAGNRHTDIITIAFNNPRLIPLHHEYLEKYYNDTHTHIVCDNSTDKRASAEIRSYCRQNGVSYIRLPKNHLKKIGGSYSHACALNWVYKYVVKPRSPHYFGITDHDLFPIRPISLAAVLDRQHVYGPLRQRGGYWYLSAILSFFDNSRLEHRRVDFMPVNHNGRDYLDTGGGLWKDLYSTMPRDTIAFCSERMENFKEGDCRHQDQVEVFDDKWLHTINGSYWKKISIEKENIIPELIKKYEL